MRIFAATLLALTLAGCGDPGNEVDFSGDEIGPDIHAIVSDDGVVKMGLTREWVYFALSDSTRAEAEAELEADAEEGGIQGFFGGIMRNVVGKALNFRAKYAITEIRDVRWEDGRMRFEFVDPERRLDDNLELGEDRSVTEAFGEEAVKEFAEAFRAVKEEGDEAQR